jgi:hypothetical protein
VAIKTDFWVFEDTYDQGRRIESSQPINPQAIDVRLQPRAQRNLNTPPSVSADLHLLAVARAHV